MTLRYVSEDRPPRLVTAGVMAERLGVPLHRVQYVLRTRQVRVSAYAGRLRLYDRAAVERVRGELARIDARSGKGAGDER